MIPLGGGRQEGRWRRWRIMSPTVSGRRQSKCGHKDRQGHKGSAWWRWREDEWQAKQRWGGLGVGVLINGSKSTMRREWWTELGKGEGGKVAREEMAQTPTYHGLMMGGGTRGKTRQVFRLRNGLWRRERQVVQRNKKGRERSLGQRWLPVCLWNNITTGFYSQRWGGNKKTK